MIGVGGRAEDQDTIAGDDKCVRCLHDHRNDSQASAGPWGGNVGIVQANGRLSSQSCGLRTQAAILLQRLALAQRPACRGINQCLPLRQRPRAHRKRGAELRRRR